jgi:hypothetical protein
VGQEYKIKTFHFFILEKVSMDTPTFTQLTFTPNGHLLIAETAIEFAQTRIVIKTEIPNDNHPLRSARLLVLEQAEAVIRHTIEQEQLQVQQESVAVAKLHARA